MNQDKLWRWALVGVLGMIALGVWVGVGTPAMARNNAQSSVATSIAMVDIVDVFSRLDERVDRDQDLKKFEEERRAIITDIATQISSIKSELSVLPDGPEARKKREELVRLEARGRIEVEIGQRVYDNEFASIQVSLARKIIDATQRVAQRDGWSVVLTDDRDSAIAEDGQSYTPAQELKLIAQRNIIAADNAIDITEEIIRLMNNEYKAGS